jgi:hypothetical protein
MNAYYRVDVNLVIAVTLMIVGWIAFFRLDRKEKINRAFFVTTGIIIVQLIIETMTCLLNGSPVPWHGSVSCVLHIILFLTAPFLTFYWYLLFRAMIIPNDRIAKTAMIFLMVPQILNAVLVFLSPSLGLSFPSIPKICIPGAMVHGQCGYHVSLLGDGDHSDCEKQP